MTRLVRMNRQTVKQSATLLFAAFCASASAPAMQAQQWAKDKLAQSPRHGEYITIAEPGGRKLQAWVVYPEIKGKAPVVVMIHEIFGLSDWAREMADELAQAGYIVVEPDLLSGFGPVSTAASLSPAQPGEAAEQRLFQLSAAVSANTGCDPMDCAPGQVPPLQRVAMQTSQPSTDHMSMQAGAPGTAYVPATPGGTAAFPDQGAVIKAVSALPDPQVLNDLNAAADYGKHLPAASGKLFVAGFCWGGGKSFLFATQRRDLSAAFVFYGPPPPTDLLKNIEAPVYGFYGGLDSRITATVEQTKMDMKAAGKTYEPVIYEGAGHGFMRAGEAPDANAANSAARQAAFRRMVSQMGGIR